MKRFIVILTMILSLPVLSFCQDNGWIRVSESQNGSESFINRNQITKTGDSLKVWVKYIEKGKDKARTIAEEMKFENNKGKSKWVNYEFEKTLILYDCNNNRCRVLEIIDYDKDGIVLASTKNNDPKDWHTIVPDSSGEKIFKAVCGID